MRSIKGRHEKAAGNDCVTASNCPAALHAEAAMTRSSRVISASKLVSRAGPACQLLTSPCRAAATASCERMATSASNQRIVVRAITS